MAASKKEKMGAKLNKIDENNMQMLISAPASLSSIVWDHFKFTKDKQFTVCNYCLAQMPHRGNTTNMFSHLTRHHPNVNLEKEGSRRKKVAKPDVYHQVHLQWLWLPYLVEINFLLTHLGL